MMVRVDILSLGEWCWCGRLVISLANFHLYPMPFDVCALVLGYLHKACARIYDRDFKYYIDFDWYRRYTYKEAMKIQAEEEAKGGQFVLPDGYKVRTLGNTILRYLTRLESLMLTVLFLFYPFLPSDFRSPMVTYFVMKKRGTVVGLVAVVSMIVFIRCVHWPFLVFNNGFRTILNLISSRCMANLGKRRDRKAIKHCSVDGCQRVISTSSSCGWCSRQSHWHSISSFHSSGISLKQPLDGGITNTHCCQIERLNYSRSSFADSNL